MARVLRKIVILCLIIAAVGLYRGWFVTQTTETSNQSTVGVTVDKTAIRNDAARVEDKATEAGQKIKEKLSPATYPATMP